MRGAKELAGGTGKATLGPLGNTFMNPASRSRRSTPLAHGVWRGGGLLLLALLLLGGIAWGQEFKFYGSWHSAHLWDPVGVPTAFSSATIHGTAFIEADAACRGVGIGSGVGKVGTLYVDRGGTLTIAQSGGSAAMLVGGYGNGTLVLELGSKVICDYGRIADAGGVSKATMTGDRSHWQINGALAVGRNGGIGTLQADLGGTVTCHSASFGDLGGEGEATVTGASSLFAITTSLSLGVSGVGRLIIVNSGKVTSAGGYVAQGTSGSGSVRVVGGGSLWENSYDLQLGVNRSGTMTIESGGVVKNASGILGYAPNSSGTVMISGASSLWHSSVYLEVGRYGSGMLRIESGAKVSNTNWGIVGEVEGATGTVTVNGAGTLWENASQLRVAAGGAGSLRIESGGRVMAASSVIADSTTGVGNAVVTGAGSRWENTNQLMVGRVGSGTLTVEDSGVVTSSYASLATLSSSAQGVLNLNGAVGGRGVLETGYLEEGASTHANGGKIRFDGGILRATGAQSNFLRSFEPGDVEILAGGAFIDTQVFNIAATAAVTGAGGLTKLGAGKLTLSGASTYLGPTTVAAGELVVSGSLTGGVRVESGTVLSGTGSLAGSSTIFGTHQPGGSPGTGTQTFSGPLTYGVASHLAWKLQANLDAGAGTNFDRVNAATVEIVPGAMIDVTLNAPGSNVNFTNVFWSQARTWTVVSSSSSVTGTFQIGTVSSDAGGRSAASYGVFYLQHTASAVNLVWSPMTTVQQWKAAFFGANASNPAIAGDSIDANNNGIPNLLEYGLGGDPLAAGGGAAIPAHGADGGGCFTLSFQRILNRGDLTLTLQGSDALDGVWTDLAQSTGGAAFIVLDPIVTVIEAGSGLTRTVVASDLRPMNDHSRPRRFLRLKATR